MKVHSESDTEKPRQAGLIPSIVLQERRRAFVNQEMVSSSQGLPFITHFQRFTLYNSLSEVYPK